MLIPRQKTPNLKLQTLNHGDFDLSQETAKVGTVICFYRGLHCPLCIKYLTELVKLLPEFEKRGVNVIAISADGQERTKDLADRLETKDLKLGYDLELAKAREWGLYISTSRGKTSIGIDEPDLFSEPGLFMITPDQNLYFGVVQTMPFVRPHFSELLGAIDFIIEKDYPARGQYTGQV